LNLLLDTHVLLWWLGDDPVLPEKARGNIAHPGNRIYVGAASAWEIGIKKALGKLDAPEDIEETTAASRFAGLPISMAHAQAAGALPLHHPDPFDRMLAAQCIEKDLRIVSRNQVFDPYGVCRIS
jgi:PIN domain nuclease of toxin-antitoxin system